MLGYLRAVGVAPTPSLSDSFTPLDELLDQYRRWLVEERGLAARTVGRYVITARRFLGERAGSGGGTGVAGLTGAHVTGFLLRECDRLSVGSAKVLVADLRSLLRFLYVRGHTGSALAAAVPPVAGWRDTALPSTLTATQVAALLDSCDRTQLIGLRDFAVLTTLARLGLRAAEVAGLELSDVNWRAGEIVVRGKGRRDERLPLPAEVGQALAGYLLTRPMTGCRTLFVTCRAPIGRLNPNTVSRIVWFACLRVGIPPVRAHRLRHTLATEMLAHGAGLADIGQVLRHRDLATTAVYAKVDRAALSQVAAPWPGATR
jgi:site-specific recombinase XerD